MFVILNVCLCSDIYNRETKCVKCFLWVCFQYSFHGAMLMTSWFGELNKGHLCISRDSLFLDPRAATGRFIVFFKYRCIYMF